MITRINAFQGLVIFFFAMTACILYSVLSVHSLSVDPTGTERPLERSAVSGATTELARQSALRLHSVLSGDGDPAALLPGSAGLGRSTADGTAAGYPEVVLIVGQAGRWSALLRAADGLIWVRPGETFNSWQVDDIAATRIRFSRENDTYEFVAFEGGGNGAD